MSEECYGSKQQCAQQKSNKQRKGTGGAEQLPVQRTSLSFQITNPSAMHSTKILPIQLPVEKCLQRTQDPSHGTAEDHHI